ncbi:hypothetical protein C2G38_2174651 [Gigaspora rosea]|uniref:Uncharacterized protein n=1 Tax=Gigaspora rosea TaxID=44941 RepID=A0A397VJW8_9GLOM|nr:hypothetical protein C2G38_2174651 [Gigaspora rosea]
MCLIGYFENAWDCNDLPLIDLLFNHSSIIEDDLKDKYDNSIHRDNKQSIKSKQEFDEMLHSLWSAEGVVQDFIASIAQNDVYFDLRLKAIHYLDIPIYTYLTIPSNNSIKHLQPLISHQLQLLLFPPRYIPYEGKEPIVHLIDRFVFLDNYSIFKKRCPNGNPFLGEKWLWEGVIKSLKSEKDYEKELTMKKERERK